MIADPMQWVNPFKQDLGMGTGFSVVCSSKRSVIISNSIRAVRRDPDVEADDTPVRIPSKLHACESRDSGIVENEIPHYLSFSRPDVNIEDEIFEDDDQNDSDNSDDTVYRLEQLENKPSRPHSCRLGNRGNTAKNRKKQGLSCTGGEISQNITPI